MKKADVTDDTIKIIIKKIYFDIKNVTLASKLKKLIY